MNTQRFEHAIALRDSGRVEEALRELTELAASAADAEEKATLLMNVSTCLMNLDRLKEAREHLSHARRIAPRTQGLLYLDFQEAALWSREDRWDKTLKILDRLKRDHGELLLAAEHRELYEQIQYFRGTALVALSRYREARAVLEECNSFHLDVSDELQALYELGACYAHLKENERAKEALEEALRRGLQGPGAVYAHYYLGKIHFSEAAYAKAMKEFEFCLSQADHGQIPKGHIYTWLAATARNLGMGRDAERYESLAKE